MKKYLSLFLALAMLLAILCGCSAQQEPETEQLPEQNTTESEPAAVPEAELPPLYTAEGLIARLNSLLAEREIPVAFEYDTLEKEGTGCTRYYRAVFPQSGQSNTLNISVHQPLLANKDITTMQVWITVDATEQEQELFPTISAVAAALYDGNITEEQAKALLTAKTADTSYSVRTGDIGAFCREEEIIHPFTKLYTYQDTFYVYCQPKDMTHSVIRCGKYGAALYQVYRVDMTKEGQKLYAEQETYVTVAELEAGINAFFAAEGIPLACEFGGDGFEPMGLETLCVWKAHFRFTSWDDPNTQYPTVNTKPYLEYKSYASDPEYAAKLMYENLPFSLTVYAGWHKDTPVVNIDAETTPLTYTDLRANGRFDVVVWDESWTEISQQFVMTVCETWDQEMGIELCGEYAAGMFAAEASRVDEDMETEDYRLICYVNKDYGSTKFSIRYLAGGEFVGQEEPETILDPRRLDYTFTFTQPILRNGIFNYASGYRYRTDICGDSSDNSYVMKHVYDFCDSAFLEVQGGEVNEGTWQNPIYVPYVVQFKGDYDKLRKFDSDFADWNTYSFEGMSEQMFRLSYNRSVKGPVDVDHVVAFGVVLSQVCDEGMTVEEAIALHTQPQEVTLVSGDWQVSYLAPRGVSHIICQNTVTGQTRYYVLPTLVFETEFETLEAFADWYLQF